MDHVFEIPDTTDWLPTQIPTFAPVEAAIRCQVCKDLFDTPMITSCSHTFCSICIRRCLTSDGKCPTCRADEQELRLRRNVTVQEIVDSFRVVRPKLLDLAKAVPANDSDLTMTISKRKLSETELDLHGVSGNTRARKSHRSRRRASPTSLEEEATIIDDSTDDADHKAGTDFPPHTVC